MVIIKVKLKLGGKWMKKAFLWFCKEFGQKCQFKKVGARWNKIGKVGAHYIF